MPNPSVGQPSELTGSPSESRSFVLSSSATLPVASATSSTPRTTSSSDASIGGGGGFSPSIEMSSPRPVTTASVPAYDSVKRFVNALWTVSVRMYVPLIIATPRTIAMPVRTARSLRPARPRRATFAQPAATSSMTVRISCWLHSPTSRTIRPSARKSTRCAIAAARASCVTMTMVWPYSSTDRRSSSRISWPVAESRLPVGSSAKRTVGPGDERAGDRDALLLAAGELRRPVREPVRRGRRPRRAARTSRRPASRPRS